VIASARLQENPVRCFAFFLLLSDEITVNLDTEFPTLASDGYDALRLNGLRIS